MSLLTIPHEFRDSLVPLLTPDRADGPDVIGLVPRQEQDRVQDALLIVRPDIGHGRVEPIDGRGGLLSVRPLPR